MLALANTGPTQDPDAAAFISFNLPRPLSHEVLQALKADPRAVALRDQSSHYYGLATRMLDLSEERELSTVLRRTFVLRAAEVGLHARKMGGGGKGKEEGSNLGVGGAGEEFLKGLDEWERKLFRKAHDGTRNGKEYLDNVAKH